MAKRRPSGDGMVRKREDGRWEGRHVIGYDEKGLPKTKSVLAKTRRECVQKLKELQQGISKPKVQTFRADICFGDWLDYWYQNHSKPRIRPTTQDKYENWIYNHVTPHLGSIPLRKLDQATFQKFLNDMKQFGRLNGTDKEGCEMAVSSVRGCYMMCRMALDKAVEEGLLKRNPAAGCKLPQNNAAEMKILGKEDLQRFLMQAKEEGMYELFLLELTTGLRRGELLALTWNDLNFKTGELRIDKQVTPAGGKLIIGPPKTNAAVRTVILPPDMVEILAEYRKNIFSPLMFPSRLKPEQPIDPCHVRKRLFRTFFVSGVSKGGENRLSQKSLSLTESYYRYRYSKKKVAIKKRDNSAKTASQKITILEYLTDHTCAKCSDLSAMLGVKDARTRRILGEMIAEGTVVAEGGNRNRTYQLKS